MEFYRCKSDIALNTTDKEPCPLCGGCDWEPVNQEEMTVSDWMQLYEGAKTPEDEFAVVSAWAETGDRTAQRILARLYLEGVGTQANEEKFFELANELMLNGDIDSIYHVACCHLYGIGTKQDPAKGLSLMWKLRDMKYCEATSHLGMLYKNGGFVSQDMKKAVKLFKQAAEQGSEDGMKEYGAWLFTNAKDEKEMEAGLSWVWRAARQDCGDAQVTLGYFLGKPGSPVHDVDQSLYWLKRAVGNEAQIAVSMYANIWFENMDEIKPCEDDAARIRQMLQEALDKGETSAAKQLGDFYRKGVFVPQDFERAYKYYRLGQGQEPGCTAGAAHCLLYGLGIQKNPGLAHLMLSDLIDKDEEAKRRAPDEALIDMGDMYRDGIGVTQDANRAAELYACSAATGSHTGAARIAQETLRGNPHVHGVSSEEALWTLESLFSGGDFDTAFFLTKHFLAAGERGKASQYMFGSLVCEDEQLDKPATKLAEKEFPDVLQKFLSFKAQDKYGNPTPESTQA